MQPTVSLLFYHSFRKNVFTYCASCRLPAPTKMICFSHYAEQNVLFVQYVEYQSKYI
jgi:hypothetical protein